MNNRLSYNYAVIEFHNILNIKLKKWFYKKFCNNNFKDCQTYEVLSLFKTIINECNFDFLQYFLKLINISKINCWMLVNECLNSNHLFLDPFVQELLKYCSPLKFENDEIKRDILFNLKNCDSTVVQFYYKEILKNNTNIKPYIDTIKTQKSHNELIKYFIDQDCDINNYKLYGYETLVSNYINYKPKLFKAF